MASSLLLKIVNFTIYFLFLGTNVFFLADPGTPYLDRKQTYLSPAYWVYALWPAIHIPIFGYVVYQFFSKGERVIINGIGWRFPLLLILSGGYVAIWSQKFYAITFVLALFVNWLMSKIFYVIKNSHTGKNINDELWINFPFSLYHSFMSYQVFLSAFEAFGSDTLVNRESTLVRILVVFVLLFLNLISCIYAFSRTEGNIAGSAAISLSIYGIYEQQTSSDFVHDAAFIFGTISLIPIGKSLFGYLVKFMFQSWLNTLFGPWRKLNKQLPFKSWRTNAQRRFVSWRPVRLGTPFLGDERTPLLGRINTFRRTPSGNPVLDPERGVVENRSSTLAKFPFFRKSQSSTTVPAQGNEQVAGSAVNKRHHLLSKAVSSSNKSHIQDEERAVTAPADEGRTNPVFERLDSLRKSVADVITPDTLVEGISEGGVSALNRLGSVHKTLSGEDVESQTNQGRFAPRLPSLGIGSMLKKSSNGSETHEEVADLYVSSVGEATVPPVEPKVSEDCAVSTVVSKPTEKSENLNRLPGLPSLPSILNVSRAPNVPSLDEGESAWIFPQITLGNNK